jgi:hypothetical protein
MGSETELLRRLKRLGHKSWHVQEAVVAHLIREYQMDKSWVLRRAIRFGRGGVRLSKSAEPAAVSSWLGVPPCYFLWILKRLIKIAVAWLKSNEQELFVSRWHLNCIWGHIVERVSLAVGGTFRVTRKPRSCADNAAAESFFWGLKRERVNRPHWLVRLQWIIFVR